MSRISYLCLLLLASAPFVLNWGYAPSTSWASENIALLLALGFSLSAGIKLKSTEHLKLPATAIALFGLTFITIISIPITKPAYLSSALIASFYFITAAIYSIIIKNNESHRNQISIIIALGLCVGGLLQLPFTLLEIFGQINSYNQWASTLSMLIPRFSDSSDASGFMQQRNLLGDYVFLSGLAGCYLFSKNKISKSAFLMISISLSFCLALASSRSILLYILCTALISLFLFFKKNESKAITRPLLLFCALSLLLQISAPLLPFLNSDSALIRATQEAPLGVRLIEWQKAWHAFVSNPLFGLGIGGYAHWSFEQAANFPFNFNSESPPLFMHSHNLILQIMAEYGLFGLGVLLIFSINLIKNIYQSKKTCESIFFTTAISTITIHSLVEFPLWYAQYFLLFITFCTLLDKNKLSVNMSTSARTSLLLITPLLFIAIGATALSWYSKLVIYSMPSKTAAQMDSKLNDLLAFSKNPVMSSDSDHALLWRLDLTDKDLNFKLNLSKRLMKYRPYQSVAYKRAIYLAYNNQQQEAIQLLKQILKNSPKSIDTFLVDFAEIQDDPRLKQLKDYLINEKLQQTE